MSALTAEQYAILSAPPGASGGMWAMLYAYFDDSGTHRGSPAIVWGGLIGTENQWKAFDAAWRALLKEPFPGKPPLSKFSVGECKRGDREFFGYGQGARDRLRYLFRDIIKQSGVVALASIAVQAEWDAVAGSRDWMEPEEWALLTSITRAMQHARAHSESLSICFDIGQQTADNEQRMKGILSRLRAKGVDIPTVVWSEVVKFTPLQGADTIATEIFWSLSESIPKKQVNLSATLRSLALDYNLKIFAQTKEVLSSNLKKSKYGPQFIDYTTWRGQGGFWNDLETTLAWGDARDGW